MNTAEKIVYALENLFEDKKIGLHEPDMALDEIENAKTCIESNYVSSIGSFVNKFEKMLQNYTKSKFCIATVNGTSALQLALLLIGVKENDEVLLPTMTFVATANAVIISKGIPHFIDSEEDTLGIDTKKLNQYLKEISIVKDGICLNKKTGRRIKAIIPMHTFGHASKMDEIIKTAKKYNLKTVEDAAEGLGSFYKRKHLGTIADIGILSFNGNKIITTGGGGAILTDNKKLAIKAKHLSTTAKINHPWAFIHDEIGFNFRMPNLNASIGCAQIKKIDYFLKNKRKLYQKYVSVFKQIENVKIFEEPKNSTSNYWLQTLILGKEICHLRDEILNKTNKKGLSTRPVWNLIHSLTPYKNYPKSDLTNAINLEKQIINLPSSSFLIDKFK